MKKERVFILVLLFALALPSLAYSQGATEEAQKYMIRGQVAMEDATDAAGFQKAVTEFRKATELAPSWADAWFNLGVAQEKAGDLSGAIASYRKYVGLSPDAPDRAAVETQIIKLEYRFEQAEKERLAAERQRQADEYLASRLVGIWQNPRVWFYADEKRKKKCENIVRGFRVKITAVGNSVTGTVIGTPAMHWDLKRCQSWYGAANVPYFKGKVINGRLVGNRNGITYSSDGAWISDNYPLDIGISMSSDGYSFKEIHPDKEPDWADEWLKE